MFFSVCWNLCLILHFAFLWLPTLATVAGFWMCWLITRRADYYVAAAGPIMLRRGRTDLWDMVAHIWHADPSHMPWSQTGAVCAVTSLPPQAHTALRGARTSQHLQIVMSILSYGSSESVCISKVFLRQTRVNQDLIFFDEKVGLNLVGFYSIHKWGLCKLFVVKTGCTACWFDFCLMLNLPNEKQKLCEC